MADFTISAGQIETTAKTVRDDDIGTIESGGRLEAAVIWEGGSARPGVTIDNSGTIAAAGANGIQASRVNFMPGSITLHNNPGATLTADNGDAFRIGDAAGGNATINNSGQIIATSSLDPITQGVGAPPNPSNFDGIDFQERGTGIVNNLGDGFISGARHGITGDQPITVINAGTISGEAGAGINLDTPPTTMTTIFNAGVIVGHAVEGLQSGDGVDVDGLVMLNNQGGSIQALGMRSGGLSEAVTIGGGAVFNSANGTISSDETAITVDRGDVEGARQDAAAPVTIFNEGTIEGKNGEAIDIFGPFADSIINNGSILGTIRTGDGNDSVDSSGASGRVVVLAGPGDDRVEGGSGDDELHGDTAFSGLPAGNDTLIGGNGNDFLDGDALSDLLIGGVGLDTFVYIPAAPDEGMDTIQDFTLGEDRIELRADFDISSIDTNNNTAIDLGDDPVSATTTIVDGAQISGLLIDFDDAKTLSVFGADPTGAPLPELTLLGIDSDIFSIA
jgi:hypothetical protein